MQDTRMDFTIENAGCLIWLAPRSLGGLTPAEVGQIWVGEGEEKTQDLVARGMMMPMSLYQDDGYRVRLRLGDLTEQEEAEWTARVRWKLNIPCGQILVSGSLSEDLEDEFAEIEPAVEGGSYWVGAYVEVPPTEYQVEVYGYPPGDLSSGWGHITDTDLFGKAAGIEPEDAHVYFQRTRPDEEMPRWLKEGYDEISYINFIIRLSPLKEELALPPLEPDGCIEWEFRKPDVCPIGIR